MNLDCKWDDCKSSFKNEKKLLLHLQDEHLYGFQCLWEGCEYTGTKFSQLKSHVKIHIQYFPFSCKECKRKFKRKYDLKKHIEAMHTRDTTKEEATPRNSVEESTETTNRVSIDFLLNND
eukprot:NODE_183_length_13752_cov_1.079103.p11 type:complete len:120 gc:universal NODE_183_length_13752_cov_1.079103:10879-11238(+)